MPADTTAQAQTWEPDQSKHAVSCGIQGSSPRPGQCTCGRDALVAELDRLRDDHLAQATLHAQWRERAETAEAELDRLHESWLKMRDRYVAEYNAHGEARAELDRVTREHAEARLHAMRNEAAMSAADIIGRREERTKAELAAAAGREQQLRDALPVFLAELKAHIDVLPAEDDEPIPDAYGNVLSSLGYLAELNFGHGDREDNPVLFDALASLRAVLEEGQP